MPKTRRLTSLAALLDEALDKGLGVGLEDGIDLIEEGVNRGGTSLDLAASLERVVDGACSASKNLIGHTVIIFR